MAKSTKSKSTFQGIALLVSVVVILALAAFAVIAQERQESSMEKRMELMADQMTQKMIEHCEKMMGDGGMAKMMSGDHDMSTMMSSDGSIELPEGMTMEEHLSHHK